VAQKSEVRDGMRIDWDMPITMDDAIVLRADIYRPPQNGRYPVILSYGPYAKGLAFQEGYSEIWKKLAERYPRALEGSTNKYMSWEVVDPEKWVPDGYVCVRVDSRGAGRSPGYLDPFSRRETRDFYLCIEWAAKQPWSNGKIGVLGISYFAMNQWDVASLQPPHLAAIIPWEGAADWYRDICRHGGIMSTFFGHWIGDEVHTGRFPGQVWRLLKIPFEGTGVQHGVGKRGPVNPNTGEPVAGPETLSDEQLAANKTGVAAAILAHPLDDEYHRERSPDWSKVTVPMLSCANWGGQGLHSRGNFEAYIRAASKQKWLEVHGKEHWAEFYTPYGLALQKRFFDHFLKDVKNDWKDQTSVQLQIRTLNGFVQRAENEWPLARTRWTRLYLDASDHSLSRKRVDAEHSVEYDALGDGVTFSTTPLEQETEITGPVAAKLFISSSTMDADLFLVLRLFAPDGSEVVFQGASDPHMPLSQGWLRASHRKLDPRLSREHRPYHTHDLVEPLKPGEVYELDVEIWPTCIVAPAGYRIGLTVRGKDYEYPGEPALELWGSFVEVLKGSADFLHDDPRDRPAEIFGGRNTIHAGGERAAYLLLPIIPK